MIKFINFLYRKWLKGECRSLCLFCEHWNVCKYDFELRGKYQKGFNEGYEIGYQDGLKEALKIAERI